ncbi:hypothetical protein HKD37_20G056398 [Glycine soja]|uniref:Uncharacterized protein n=1 Tax=Glycine max TaxID=3847 RepID=C6TF74_SOYBN|nr:unknown [Glycine max]KAH1190112.1 hypothetical protein GmHk_20G057748 [Glycine max]
MKKKGVLVDIRVIEIVLEIVEEIGVGEFVVGGDDALGEDLERVDVVHVHCHRRYLLVHLSEQVH